MMLVNAMPTRCEKLLQNLSRVQIEIYQLHSVWDRNKHLSSTPRAVDLKTRSTIINYKLLSAIRTLKNNVGIANLGTAVSFVNGQFDIFVSHIQSPLVA
jgi:hypothetical protein